MEQNALTVIVPIKTEEVEALRKILTEIGEDIKGNQYVRFRETPSTHFARWVILENRDFDTDPKFPRLLFTSNYDGSFESYMKELVEKVGPGMEQVWNKCKGYSPHTSKDTKRFADFIQRHSLKYAAFYNAFRGATVENILNSIEIRKTIDQILDSKEIEPSLRQLSKLLPRVAQTPAQPLGSGTNLQAGGNGSRQPKLSLPERLIEWVVGVRSGINNPNIRLKVNPDLIKIEDKAGVVQNQITVISPIKPQILPQILVRLILWVANRNARASYGSLSGLTTIHFARWVIIDNGKNLLFESNFDGSWENYIDDFVDRASVAMNGIWANAVGYPIGGCRDIESFKQIIRDHQVPTQVFYSAYPEATVKNILNDLPLSKGVEQFLRQKEVERFISGSYSSLV